MQGTKEDFEFISIDEEERGYDVCALPSVHDVEAEIPVGEKATCENSQFRGFGGYRQFLGLADVSLTTMLAHRQSARSPVPLSETDVMKVRSIMRFATEYHNALVIRAQSSPRPNPLYEFTDAASECFREMYEIVVAALGAESADDATRPGLAAKCARFRVALVKLHSLELPAKESVGGTLKQAVGAVSGQMRDFGGLVENCIIPNLPK